MALTDPYDVRWLTTLGQPLEHLVSADAWHPSWAAPIALPIESGTLTFDEGTYPYAVADMVLRVPLTQAELDALDPRKGVRVRITLGYRQPGGLTEQHRVVSLALWSRRVTRPDNRVHLSARGAESTLLEWTPVGGESMSFTSASDAGASIAALISWALPGAAIVNTLPPASFVTGADTLAIDAGDNLMRAVYDIADRAGSGWVYEDGNGTWHIRPRPTLVGQSAAILKVGPGGTLKSSEADLSLDEFYNVALVTYEWYDGEARTASGYAQIDSGPFAVAVVGRRVYSERRSYQGSSTEARRAAAALVNRTVSRGRALRGESAAAAYWLRPGHTVTVTLPAGPQERHLVATVQFDLAGSGVMNFTTRLPETVTITTGA